MTALDTDLVVHSYGRPLGEAPILLLLHGLTDSGAGWTEAVRHWEERYTLLAPDQRGHGLSPRFGEDDFEQHPGEVMVADATALLEQLPDPPVVIGHSLGGAVALVAAVRRPDLVRAAVLEDPAPRGPHEPQASAHRGQEYLDSLQDSLTAADDLALLDLRRTAHPDWPEDELLPTGRAEQQMDLAYLAAGDFQPTTPWPELFDQVTVPTLVLSGDLDTRADELCVDAEVERGIEKAGNRQLRLVRVQGAGHCIRRDRPDRYYAEVDAWLSGLGVGS